jgi:subtilisin family serine protease
MKKFIYLYFAFIYSLILWSGVSEIYAEGNGELVNGTFTSQVATYVNNTPKRGPRPPINVSELTPDDYNPGVFRVKFSSDSADDLTENIFSRNKSGIITTGIEDFDLLSQQYHIYDGRMVAENLFSASEKSVSTIHERHREWGFHLWYEFRTASKSDLLQIVDQFQSLESVEIAQPVFRVISEASEEFTEIDDAHEVSPYLNTKSQMATNDPRYIDQWNLQNNGQKGGVLGADISIPNAWNLERGRKEVVVAIIDGGIKIDHPDLAVNIWRDSDGNAGYNFADKTNNIVPTNHATHVAGIVSAVSNNEMGVAGIAGGCGNTSGVALMVCQVFSDNRSDGFHLAPIFAADNGAAISQNSWTYAAPNVYDHLALDAIDYFNTYGGGMVLEGGITIFSAGNRGREDKYYPAAYEGAIAVASTNNRDAKASNSNYGDWIDISAPGVSILSTLANDSYGYSSGTSMAAPHVAGVAALIVSNATTKMKASDVIDVIISTADDHYVSNEQYTGKLGSGRINAYAALMAIQPEGYQPDDSDNNQPDNPEDGYEEQDQDEDGEQVDEDDSSTSSGSPETEYHFLRDGDWNDLENWFADKDGETPVTKLPLTTLPSQNSTTFISAIAFSSDPVIIDGSGKLIIKPGGKLITDEVIIESCENQTESLVVYPGGMLTVAENFINNGGVEAILIVSDETGSGSIIHVSPDVQASYQYSNANKTQKPWNTISIPLMNQASGQQVINGTAYAWDEPGQTWIIVNDGTQTTDTNTPKYNGNSLEAGIGYLVSESSESVSTTSTLTGVLTGGEFSFVLSRLGQPDHSFAGFNLVGNPYPSGIDWKQENGWVGRSNLVSNGSTPGVSFWSWNPQTGNYGAYNNSSHNDAGTNQVSRYISPLQAFWVKADKHDTSFSVNQNARIHYPVTSEDKSAGDQFSSIRLLVDNYTNTYSDELLLEFGHASTGGAEKIFSMLPDAPSFFSVFDEDQMSILFLQQTMNHPKIDVGFMAGIDAVHTITAQSIQGIKEDVFLLDKQTGHRHNLSQHASYQFSASVNDDPDRFEIHFGEDLQTSVMEKDMDAPEIYYTSGQLHVYNPWTTIADVQVFNLAGSCVAEFTSAAFASHQNPFNGKSGVYVVKMTSQDQQFATRIMAW